MQLDLFIVYITMPVNPKLGLKALHCHAKCMAPNQSQAEAMALAQFHEHVQNFNRQKYDYAAFCAAAEIKTKQQTEPLILNCNWDVQ